MTPKLNIKKEYKRWLEEKAQGEYEESSYKYDDRRNFVPIPREEK